MNCKDFLDRHTEWLDGEIEPASARELMAHANTCESCARYDRVVRRGTDLVRELLPEVTVSDDFGVRMRHRLYHERDAMARRRTTIPSVYAAAASIVFVSLGAAALALSAGRTPVVDGNVVFASAPAAMTSLAKHAFAVSTAPTFTPAETPRDGDRREPATGAGPAPDEEKEALEAELEPWPVYSRNAVAVVFPASRSGVVARPADFRPVGTRSAATPLIIRY